MCCKSVARCWLFFILILWLLLACTRQVFDLIGKLWLPVIFNLLQILGCISGLFAAGQQRISLLITLIILSLITIIYNVLLMLFYANIISNRNDKIMSFGLPYSHSFFLRYTPFCKSHYNLDTNQWIQDKSCIIPYYNIEGIQAMIHTVFGILTILLSLLLICETRSTTKSQKQRLNDDDIGYSSNRSNKSNQSRQMPNLAASIYGEAEKQINNKSVPPPPDSINDVSSGYMNSSYEAVISDENKIKKINKNKKSNKKIGELQEQDDYSSVTTKSLTNSSVESRKIKPRPRAFQTKNSTTKKMINRSVSPIRRNSDEGFSEDEISKQYSKMRQKSLPCKRPQSMAEQRLSQAALEQMKKESFKKEQKDDKTTIRQRINTPDLHNKEDSSEYLEYIKAERKNSSGNLTSLISFDPKSNTLIRVHEHISNDEDDTTTTTTTTTKTSKMDNNPYKEIINTETKLKDQRTISQESVPSIQAPLLTGSQLHLDSGHPSTSTTSVSPDWSQAGIYHVMQRPNMSPPLPPKNNFIENKMTENYSNQIFSSSLISAFRTVKDNDDQSSENSSNNSVIRSTSFSSQPPYMSVSTAIPLRDTYPEQSTQFSSTQNQQQLLKQPSYTHLSSSTVPISTVSNHELSPPPLPKRTNYYSSNEYGLKLLPNDSNPPSSSTSEKDKERKTSESTQFDSKPLPSTPIILSNAGLLV